MTKLNFKKMVYKQFLFTSFVLTGSAIFLSSCQKKSDTPSETPAPRYLYVTSGTCYSGGGNTTFSNTTASNLVYRINVDSGQKESVIADYNASPAISGDSPVGIAEMDSENLYILVENTTTTGSRRIEIVPKNKDLDRTYFSTNTTALSAQLRRLLKTSSGDLLISKSTAIELLTSNNARITKGANPYISAPASPCATSTTLMSDLFNLNNGFIGFLHAATSQNRIGFVKAEGYSTAGDCTVAQSAPNASSFPVAAVYDSTNYKLIVAYAGNATTTNINSIYSYDITETSSSVSVGTANKIYDASEYPTTYSYLLYGISAMTLDSTTSSLYVSTAVNTSTTVVNYSIEKFTYDATKIGSSNSTVLTRIGSSSFYPYNNETKCISSMMVAY